MFWFVLAVVVLVILPAACALIPEGHDNGYVHNSGEGRDGTGDDDPDIMLAAGTGKMAA